LRDGLGLGEASRGFAAAFAAAGCEVLQHFVRLPGRPFPNGDPGPEGVLPFPEAGAEAAADFVLVCLCPPELETLQREGIPLPAGRINAGLWVWDVDPLPPSWAVSAHSFNEIWSPTSYVTRLLREALTTPVYTAPLAVRRPASGGHSEYLRPDRPTVVAFADVASTLERKNPAGAIEAFKRAFTPDEGPRLLVKIWNGAADPEGRYRLESLIKGRDDIVLLDRWLPRTEFVSLLDGAWCLLSLHRAEGFGLPIFEALSLGTPVIATAYSGPMDFLDDSVAALIPVLPATVPEGVPAYPAGSIWAEPDVDAAAAALRWLWRHPNDGKDRADRGRRLVAERLAPEVVGKSITAHVIELLAALP
jgi:glycosyltransferase involved in cell wall biosynthesis